MATAHSMVDFCQLVLVSSTEGLGEQWRPLQCRQCPPTSKAGSVLELIALPLYSWNSLRSQT